MKTLLTGAMVYRRGGFTRQDILVEDGVISALGEALPREDCHSFFDFSGLHIFPGFADVHVHLREPGFSYKETIACGTRAAAAGGYTAVCAMPNVSPPPGTVAGLMAQLDIIRRDAVIPVLPYACITREQTGSGDLVDFAALKPLCFGFSDDGKGIQDAALMERAMAEIHKVGGFMAAHVEDESLLRGGYIHDGTYAREHGHKGICSESEWGQLKRDLELVRATCCRYHMCHVSTKESVALLRAAKQEGLPVTAETAPHYLVLCDTYLRDEGRFKMNPPLREEADRDALVEGLLDGTIDMIATDHAPHHWEEKAEGLEKAAMGVVGLETAFSVLYTFLVQRGLLSLEQLVDRMAIAPRRVFPHLPGGEIEVGRPANLCVWNLDYRRMIESQTFYSKGRATPFDKLQVSSRCCITMANGKIVHRVGV